MILYVIINTNGTQPDIQILELKTIDELKTSIDPVLMNEQEQWTEFVRIITFVIGIETEEVQEIYKKNEQFDIIRDNISEISTRDYLSESYI